MSFLSPRLLIRFFALPLCMVALAVSFFNFTLVAHATGPSYIEGPSIQCLDVLGSSTSDAETVAVSNPAGGGVRFSLALYVTVSTNSPCTNSMLVNNITVTGIITGTCTSGSSSGTTVVFNGPYGLYRGGGYGSDYIVNDRCIVYENGVPTTSLVPASVNVSIDASGSTINGNVRQVVTSNSIIIHAWLL